VDESNRDLAEYSGTQVAQTRLVPLCPGLTSQSVRIHRLLQPHDGPAFQVDLSR